MLLLRTSEVELILADLSLPDAYGLEVVHQCSSFAPEVPIIVLTACRDVELALEALEEARRLSRQRRVHRRRSLRAIRYAFARSHAAPNYGPRCTH